MCNNCKNLKEMPLEERVYNCPVCGLNIDRDLNASKNIKEIGINKIKDTVGHTGIYACGDCVKPIEYRLRSMKQEKEFLNN